MVKSESRPLAELATILMQYTSLVEEDVTCTEISQWSPDWADAVTAQMESCKLELVEPQIFGRKFSFNCLQYVRVHMNRKSITHLRSISLHKTIGPAVS